MKKLLLSFTFCFFIVGMTFAQINVPQNSKALYVKKTATWCGPCGGWGWDLNNQITADIEGKAIIISAYGSSSSNYYNNTAGAFGNSFASGSGYPAFCLNGSNRTVYVGTSINTAQTRTDIVTDVNTFVNQNPIAQTGFDAYYQNGNLVVDTKTEFFTDTSGQFFLGAYAIEEDVVGYQNGNAAGNNTVHHAVLRGGFTITPFGTPLTSGAITAGSSFTHTFTMAVNPTWNTNKVKVAVMLFRSGAGFEYINGNGGNNFVGLDEDYFKDDFMKVFPNPVTNNEQAIIRINSNEQEDLSIEIFNSIGQKVKSVFTGNMVGNKDFYVDVNDLNAGLYFVKVSSNTSNKTKTLRLNVVK